MTLRQSIDSALGYARWQLAWTIIFPRSVRVFSPAPYLGPRGLVIYLAGNTAFHYALSY